jgi:hypothetical protein
MKKNGILLIFILLSLTGFPKAVIWSPAGGGIYGDKMRITINTDLDYIENQFIDYSEGEIIETPVYYLNGFQAPATYFEWQDNNSMYVSRLAYPALYAGKDADTIIITFRTSDNVLHSDTAVYYYSKPVLECQQVNGQAYTPGMVLVNPSGLSLNVLVKSSLYQETVDNGNDMIREIDQVIDGGEIALNEDIVDTRYASLTLNADIEGFSYGVHEIELFAKGKKADQAYPDEFSDRISVRVLIIDFALVNDPDFAVCQCDCGYYLTGMPQGGIFSGETVLESSNVFNPTAVTGSSSQITYSFPVDGIYYPVARTVTFDPVPVLSLTAQPQNGYAHEACGYEHGVEYVITAPENADIEWTLPDGLARNNYLSGNNMVIDWGEPGDGTISLAATSDKGCTGTLDFMIHISGINQAPVDSAYVTLLDKMLFCDADTTKIKLFYWHGVKGADTIPVTTKPYYYLGYLPDAGDSFYVSTAVDQYSCTTDSHIFTKTKALGVPGENGQTIRIYPNPAHGNVNCEFLQPFAGCTLAICNLVGQEILRKDFSSVGAGDVFRLDTEDYQKGIYFLTFSNNSISRSYKFIVY